MSHIAIVFCQVKIDKIFDELTEMNKLNLCVYYFQKYITLIFSYYILKECWCIFSHTMYKTYTYISKVIKLKEMIPIKKKAFSSMQLSNMDLKLFIIFSRFKIILLAFTWLEMRERKIVITCSSISTELLANFHKSIEVFFKIRYA